MIDEKQIEDYRKFHKQLLPVIGSRYVVTRSLETFLKQLYPYLQSMSKQEYFRDNELRTLRREIESFITKSFPGPIFKLFDNPPKFEQRLPVSTGQLTTDLALHILMERISKIRNRYSDTKINELTFQYNFLYKIHDCLKDYGLHKDIQKRNASSFLRYNIMIEHDIDKKHKEVECMHLITKEKLIKSFIEPYHNEKPVLINGVKIYPKNNKRSTITTTLLKDDEIDLFKEKNNCRSWLDFVRHCKDETNQLLDNLHVREKNEAREVKQVPFIGLLINNPNISHVVVDAYFRLVPQPSSREMVSTAYVGPLNHYNSPFKVSIHGAFPLMIDWEMVDYQINSGHFSQYGLSKVEIDTYLIKYGQAFIQGYYSFEKELLDKHSSVFNELSDKQQKIFDYATNWFMNRSGFPEAFGGSRHILSIWPEAGRDAGYFYRAWYIILENSKRFEPLFDIHQLPAKDVFLDKFIEGVEKLQGMDSRLPFIQLLKSGKKKDEAAFRDWFITFFSGAGYEFVEAEPLKGNGRIDLKIQDKKIGKKIIEFKGWWNSDVAQIAEQISGYLTDFDKSGYILLINHLKKRDVSKLYKEILAIPGTGYIDGTWQEIPHSNSHFAYFVSEHRLGNKNKIIYHLIYRLYP